MSNSNKTMRTFGGPPVLVSKFVQTHAWVHFGDSGVYAELWEHPRRTYHRLRATERIADPRVLPSPALSGREA